MVFIDSVVQFWSTEYRPCLFGIQIITVPNMRVVGLREKRDQAGTLLWSLEENEAESHDGGASHIVINVADGNMQKSTNGRVGAGAAVGHGNGVHARPTQDGVLESV